MRSARRIALVLGLVPLLIVGALVSAGAQERRSSAQDGSCQEAQAPDAAEQPTKFSDALRGDQQQDDIHGGNGQDVVTGLGGDDCLFGGDDADTLVGGADDDTLRGNEGTDDLSGGSGDDELAGGDGDDHLSDNSGTNTVDGDDGDDVIDAGDPEKVTLENPRTTDTAQVSAVSVSTLSGGTGSDWINSANGIKDIVDCGSDVDTAITDSADQVSNCEYRIDIKKPGAVTLIKKPG
jgi:RTX calcium-binding nonapeptide repeat (4 copies)